MRFLAPIVGLLSLASTLVPTVLADAKPLKFTALTAGSKLKGIVKLNDTLYTELTAAPRNYSAVVLLTALDQRFNCLLCQEFQPEYELLAKSWIARHRSSDGLFFGELDFANAKATFQKLQLTTAPILYLFPPTIGDNLDAAHIETPYQFDFTQHGVPAEAVAHFISQHSPHTPPVTRPFDYVKFGSVAGLLLVAITIASIAFSIIKPIIYSRNLWAAISLIAVLLFTSGHMFNHIRHVPYVVNDGRGGVSYIASGFSNQFGLETQIVAIVYAILAFATISLAMKTPRIEDPTRQKAAILIWNAVLLVGFSFLMSLFKQKNGSYPFFLPPLF
ncbi:unnamed protein product [Tuber melanosporum]|jgi:oligosaccharyltransferase complex subunit gamma|uniref:(Perigord truffle) hypothetical protein n=1 Tax=Tuber melanosporum (strain Mel28) TaxID=656061 RepID=D5GBN0_TUBMM|nr:uncharacterized protein GSTUM_00005486001 [Tuber melanosporum]CAZ81880.1 unnamed protein product [Tuber melanosporum]